MKLFVTGGTGFIGSHFLRKMSAVNESILALRRPGSQSRASIAHEPIWLEKSMEEVCESDLADVSSVIHLAAFSANVPYKSYHECLYWNVLAPIKMFQVAINAGVRRFIVAGSCFEYGKPAEKYKYIPVDAALEPSGSYPTSKALASLAFSGLAREKGLKLSILRIFQVYGPGEHESRFWPNLKKKAENGEDFQMSPGEQIRDFIRVERVADRFVSELATDVPAGKPIVRHVGTGNPKSLKEFAAAEWAESKAKGRLLIGALPYRNGEIMRLVPSLS